MASTTKTTERTFPQSRVTVDSMAEFQILTHRVRGGIRRGIRVIVNAITKSGTNQIHGRGFYFLQDAKLNATNYFLKLARGEKPGQRHEVDGGNIGGPIVRNKAFWFFNYEYHALPRGRHLSFPPAAAPLAVSFSDVYNVHLKNYFVRGTTSSTRRIRCTAASSMDRMMGMVRTRRPSDTPKRLPI